MRNVCTCLLLVTVSVFLLDGAAVGDGKGASPRVGAASADITPPLDMPMAGYYHERLATGLHDRLHAKAIYVQGDDVEFVWVFCDLCSIDRQTVQEARERIRERIGVPASNILIAATHTHTGPRYARDSFSAMQKGYIKTLVERIAESAEKARASAKSASVFSSSAREESLSFNRRFHMKSGEVRFNPGRGNPDIVGPAGPIDPQVSVFTFRPAGGGEPLAVLVSFTLHLDTVGGTKFSADFPYFMGEKLKARLDPNLLPIFAQGTSGDVNHIDVNDPKQRKGLELTQQLGETLADDVLKAIEKERPASSSPIRVVSKVLRIPLQTYTPEDLDKSREVVKATKRSFLELVRAHKILRLHRRKSDSMKVEIQVVLHILHLHSVAQLWIILAIHTT